MTERRPKLSTCSIATVRGISFSFPIAEDFQISAQLLALRTFRKESSPLRSPSRSAFALWEELGTFGPWQVLVPLCSAPLGNGVRSTGSGGASAALISAPAPLSSTGAEAWELQSSSPTSMGAERWAVCPWPPWHGGGAATTQRVQSCEPCAVCTQIKHTTPPALQSTPAAPVQHRARPNRRAVWVEGPSGVTLCHSPALRPAALAVPALLGSLGSGWQPALPAPLARRAPDEALLSDIITSVGDATYKPAGRDRGVFRCGAMHLNVGVYLSRGPSPYRET